MSRYVILENEGTLWAWDDNDQTMYQKEPELDIGVKRPINLQMLSKFVPTCVIIEETDQAPDWVAESLAK